MHKHAASSGTVPLSMRWWWGVTRLVVAKCDCMSCLQARAVLLYGQLPRPTRSPLPQHRRHHLLPLTVELGACATVGHRAPGPVFL